MPIYEYKCKKCGYKFEQLQKITDKPLHACPQCRKTSLEKLVSNTSFQLKGTGWYVTDFKNKDTKIEKPKNNHDIPSKKKDNKTPSKITPTTKK